MQKKKIINFRPLFYCFISYGFAIIFAGKLFSGHFAYTALFFSLILVGFLLAFYKKAFLEFSLCAVAIMLGLSSFFVSLNKYSLATSYDTPVVVSGTIASVRDYSSGQQIVLNNIKIDDTNKSFSISLFNYEAVFSVGDYLEIQTNLSKVTPFNLDKFSSYYYNNNIFYTATYSNSIMINHTKTSLPLKEQIKQSTLNAFLSVMPKEIAHIAYGAMFGDASGISADIYSSFRDSGIIHILSVSGMHMVIVVGIVDFFLRKSKLNKYARFSIFASCLIFYSYLCSFNVTVVRSCLMSLILIFGSSFGKRYDMLNAIGLSGLAILVFKPLMIFDIGFQFSYLSVFMIAGFSKPISNFLQKKGLNQKLSIALGTSLAVQAGLFPLTLKYFGQFPLAGTIANLIAVPIFELGFVIAFVLNIVLMFLPFLTFLLLPISFLFGLTIQISNFLASIDFLLISGYLPSSIIILFFLLIVFIASPFVMLRKNFKQPLILLLALMCFVFCFVDLKPKQYHNLTIFQANYGSANSTIFATENERILISDFKDINHLSVYLHQARLKSFNILVLAEDYSQQNLEEFKQKFDIDLILNPNEAFDSKTFSIDYLTLSEKNFPIIKIYGYKTLMLPSSLSLQEENHLNLIKNSLNSNIVLQWQTSNINFNADYIITKNSLSSPDLKFEELNNWYFELKNGKINFVRSLN